MNIDDENCKQCSFEEQRGGQVVRCEIATEMIVSPISFFTLEAPSHVMSSDLCRARRVVRSRGGAERYLPPVAVGGSGAYLTALPRSCMHQHGNDQR